jgi:uncharacterized protein YihD (DUF1040 family)
MEFPKFDGENPILWRDRCVLYFEVYGTHLTMKTRFALLNFQGSAATWLQTIERRGRITDWQKLCDLVFAKYDQYRTQLHQLENLKQTRSVAEYQHQFEQLTHGILLYNLAYDDVYFITRFVAGLKEEIRAAITLHQPQDVDTASALALLQEELNVSKNKNLGRVFSKGLDRGLADRGTAVDTEKGKNKQQRPEMDEKLATLKLYRRRNGLCFKCGAKWGPNHTFPDQIPLHLLEELLTALQIQESDDMDEVQSEDTVIEDNVMAVQSDPKLRNGKRQTLKLLARIGKQHVFLLVDSGSVGTFISEELVKKLKLQTEACDSATYKVADRGQL